MDKAYVLSCDLQRSIRYHKARERFFSSWSNMISFLSLLSGSAVVVTLLAKQPEWVSLSFGAAVALLQAVEQVGRLAAKARDHSGFTSEFAALERVLVLNAPADDQMIKELQAEILTIEAREPPIKRYLDLICHNQVAISLGSSDIVTLTFWQRHLAHYLNGDQALQTRM